MAKILIVEDDCDIAAVMKEWFSVHRHSADVVSQCSRALSWLATHECDVIVLDLELPDGDGSKVVRELRNQQNATPILVASSRSSFDTKAFCLKIGADDYLEKPFHFKELLNRVHSLIGKHQQPGS